MAYRDQVVEAYLAGKSTLAVADQYGCSPQFVSSELRERGIQTRGPQELQVAPNEASEVRRRYLAGESMIVIGRALGMDPKRVSREIHRQGIFEKKGSPYRRLSTEVRREIADRYVKGESARSLIREYGIAKNSVYKFVREFGGEARVQGARRPPLRTDEREAMVDRYLAGESQQALGMAFGLAQATVSGVLRTAGVLTRGSKQIKGENHPSWKGGRYVTSEGYVKIRTQEFPEMRGSHPYIPEHRLVMARCLGRPLTSREQVHHKNGNKGDNRIENLELRVGPHGSGATHAHCSTCTCFQH